MNLHLIGLMRGPGHLYLKRYQDIETGKPVVMSGEQVTNITSRARMHQQEDKKYSSKVFVFLARIHATPKS